MSSATIITSPATAPTICMLSYDGDGQSWSVVPDVPPFPMVGACSFSELPDAPASSAMCVYQAPGRGLRCATFDGAAWSTDDSPVSNAASCASPSLVSFQNQVFCFYQGTDSHGARTGLLKYVMYDGTWSEEASVPNAPGLSSSPSAVVYTNFADTAADLLYCLYQGSGDNGRLSGVTYDGKGTWAPLVLPNDLPGMSNSPSAVVFDGELYCLYQDYGARGGMAGSIFNAGRATWYPLNGGKDVTISGISGAALSGSPAAAVWTGGQLDSTTDVTDPTTDTEVAPPQSALICLFQGGGNNGKLQCVQFDGLTWQLQATFGVAMPSGSSPSVGTYLGYTVAAFQGTIPGLLADLPMALGDQDTYQRVPFSGQTAILTAAGGGSDLQNFVQEQGATALFFGWLAQAGEAAWIQVVDTTTNDVYLVAMQEGGTPDESIELVLSATQVDPTEAESSATTHPPLTVPADHGRLKVDRDDVDLDRLSRVIAAVTASSSQPTSSRPDTAAVLTAGDPPPYTPPSTIVVNGITYKVVGTVSTSLVVNKQLRALIEIPLGVVALSVIPLLKIAWPVVIRPVLAAVASGVLRVIGYGATTEVGAAAGTVEMAAQGAEASAVEFTALEGAGEGAAVASASVATGGLALAGAAVIAAGCAVVQFFVLHDTYHSLRVYNMTPYDVTWAIPYYNNGHGALALSPAMAVGSSSVNTVIPAIGSQIIGGTPQNVFREADFGIASASWTNGVQYVMTFALADTTDAHNPVGAGAVLFDIPFVGSNSFYAAVTSTPESPAPMSATACQTFYQTHSGTSNNLTSYTAKGPLNDGATLQLTTSYDQLSGKQVPPGQPGAAAQYWYNSIVTLQVPSQT